MTEVKVCSFPPNLSLTPIEQNLSNMGVRFRIEHLENRQELYVDDDALPQVTALLDQLTASQPKARLLSFNRTVMLNAIARTPVTYTLIILSILGYFAVNMLSLNVDVLSYLTFTKVKLYPSYVVTSDFATTYVQGQQWWRLISPIFLHFGVFHIMFNSLAALEFGRRIELVLKSTWFIAAVLIIGVGSNTAQYLSSESSLFGGLSGVVYGLFGMLLSLYWRSKIPVLKIPKGFAIMILATLMLGPLGVLENLFGVAVADQAHFAGLFLGVLIGLVIPYHSHLGKKNDDST